MLYPPTHRKQIKQETQAKTSTEICYLKEYLHPEKRNTIILFSDILSMSPRVYNPQDDVTKRRNYKSLNTTCLLNLEKMVNTILGESSS